MVIICIVICHGYYNIKNEVTKYYRKGSLQYDIITGNYVFARIKVLFGENVNEIDKKIIQHH